MRGGCTQSNAASSYNQNKPLFMSIASQRSRVPKQLSFAALLLVLPPSPFSRVRDIRLHAGKLQYWMRVGGAVSLGRFPMGAPAWSLQAAPRLETERVLGGSFSIGASVESPRSSYTSERPQRGHLGPSAVRSCLKI